MNDRVGVKIDTSKVVLEKYVEQAEEKEEVLDVESQG